MRDCISQRRTQGFTLLELLIALAILAVALLALSATLTGGMVGIRQDAQRSVANQVATSVLEERREWIRSERGRDQGAESDVPVATPVPGQAYTARYTVVPSQLDVSGQRVAVPAGGAAHVFEVIVEVITPRGATYTYRTLIVGNPP